MKNLIKTKTITLLISAAFLASCSAFRQFDATKLSIGMDKEAAFAALRLKPSGVVAVKQYPGGTIEVDEFITGVDASGKVDRSNKYWLYFFNNKLAQYGRPGNWEEQAEQIVALKRQ